MKFKLWAIIPLCVFMLLSIFFLRGLSLDPHHLPSVYVGRLLPDFKVPQLGKSDSYVTSRDFHGRMVLLNVFASWCKACTEEQHFLWRLARQGVLIYGINYKDAPEAALQWLTVWGNPYQWVGSDVEGKLAIDLGVYGAPETFLIDKEGHILYRHAGILNEAVWRTHFLPLMENNEKIV